MIKTGKLKPADNLGNKTNDRFQKEEKTKNTITSNIDSGKWMIFFS